MKYPLFLLLICFSVFPAFSNEDPNYRHALMLGGQVNAYYMNSSSAFTVGWQMESRKYFTATPYLKASFGNILNTSEHMSDTSYSSFTTSQRLIESENGVNLMFANDFVSMGFQLFLYNRFVDGFYGKTYDMGLGTSFKVETAPVFNRLKVSWSVLGFQYSLTDDDHSVVSSIGIGYVFGNNRKM